VCQFIPKNLPVVFCEKLNPTAAQVVEGILNGNITAPVVILGSLGRNWKLRVTFKQPVSIRHGRKFIPNMVHVINGMFHNKGILAYTLKEGSRTGYNFGDFLPLVESVEVILHKENRFKSYEQFARHFDTKYIAESMIRKLWIENSPQTGQRYCPSDFKRIPKAADWAMTQFKRNFAGIDTLRKEWPECYRPSQFGAYKVLQEYCGDFHGIHYDVEHISNREYVFFQKNDKGEERNGILATATTYLHTEDD